MSTFKNIIRITFATLALAILVGCGGGDTTTNNYITQSAPAPVVTAQALPSADFTAVRSTCSREGSPYFYGESDRPMFCYILRAGAEVSVELVQTIKTYGDILDVGRAFARIKAVQFLDSGPKVVSQSLSFTAGSLTLTATVKVPKDQDVVLQVQGDTTSDGTYVGAGKVGFMVSGFKVSNLDAKTVTLTTLSTSDYTTNLQPFQAVPDLLVTSRSANYDWSPGYAVFGGVQITNLSPFPAIVSKSRVTFTGSVADANVASYSANGSATIASGCLSGLWVSTFDAQFQNKGDVLSLQTLQTYNLLSTTFTIPPYSSAYVDVKADSSSCSVPYFGMYIDMGASFDFMYQGVAPQSRGSGQATNRISFPVRNEKG